MILRLAAVASLLLLALGARAASSSSSSSASARRLSRGGMEVVAEWRTVDFEFPSRLMREAAVHAGEFVAENVIIIDVDAHGEGKRQRIFVTTPRLKHGVPATLSELSPDESSVAPRLRPFPSWAWNDASDCDNLVSVFRTATDQCGRLWVLDSGTVNVFAGAERRCPPKLVVFDLRGQDGAELVERYTFPAEQREHTTLAITVAVDVRGQDAASCGDAFAYVADVTEPAILVYDMSRNRSWRVLSNLLYPYPLQGGFKMNGVEFDLMDGVFGMAVGPVVNGDRRLFFHSLASVRESWVSCRLLRNQSLFEEEPSPAVARQFHVSEPRRTSQSAAEAADANGVLFFSLLSENALACWNTRLPYSPANVHVVAKDDKTMQFASGLKVVGRHVWMLSSRFQNVMVGRVRHEEVNYRVLVAPVADLVQGTSCAAAAGPGDNLVEVDTGPPLFRPPSVGTYGGVLHHQQHLHHHHAQPPSGPSGFGPSSFGSTQPSYGAPGVHGGVGSSAGTGFGFSHRTPHPRPAGSMVGSTKQPSSYHQQLHGADRPGSGGSGSSAPSAVGFSSSGSGDSIVFRDPMEGY